MDNTVVWFDIPVSDLSRAEAFYGKVFSLRLQRLKDSPTPIAWFPFTPGRASGALVQSRTQRPSARGTIVYLNGGDDLATALARVNNAGGRVLQAKTAIGEYGYIAYFEDSEGNRVGIHSPN